jgi:hypothetical protein
LSNRKKIIAVGLVAAAIALTGCSTEPPSPDSVGLYYNKGASEGYEFDHCTVPGQVDDMTINDEIIWLPINLRTFNIGTNGDQTNAVVVSSKPEKDQPSGVQVNVFSTTSFYLNTFCDANGGVIKDFWEKLGRRYDIADDAGLKDDGWRKMLEQVLVPSLEKATQDVIREYEADALVGNVGGIRAEAQAKISSAFTAELKRLTGADFFCGPKFDRVKSECPQIEMIIKDVDYNDPGIQQARNEKQKAIELGAAKLATAKAEAAALLAEAQGKADAANKLNALYKNPAWVRLQDTILKTQALIEACKQAKECKLIVGADGNLIMA